jgi:hypothetical protein
MISSGSDPDHDHASGASSLRTSTSVRVTDGAAVDEGVNSS